jgi:hypothetical protein
MLRSPLRQGNGIRRHPAVIEAASLDEGNAAGWLASAGLDAPRPRRPFRSSAPPCDAQCVNGDDLIGLSDVDLAQRFGDLAGAVCAVDGEVGDALFGFLSETLERWSPELGRAAIVHRGARTTRTRCSTRSTTCAAARRRGRCATRSLRATSGAPGLPAGRTAVLVGVCLEGLHGSAPTEEAPAVGVLADARARTIAHPDAGGDRDRGLCSLGCA